MSNTITNPNSLTLIDQLIAQVPSEMDTLLDIRLAIMKKAEPGLCVTSYFKLTKSLSKWHQKSLLEIRSLLESKIQLEITVEESNQRRRSCLDLGTSNDLSLYCEQQMKTASLQNKTASKILMTFCWSETA